MKSQATANGGRPSDRNRQFHHRFPGTLRKGGGYTESSAEGPFSACPAAERPAARPGVETTYTGR